MAVEAKSKASKSVEEPPVVARRSSRKQAQPQFVSRLDHKVMDEDEISAEVMVRSAAKPLQHHVVTSSSSTFVETSSTTTKAPVFVAATPVALEDKEEKQPIVLAYEETKKLVEEEESVLLAPSTQHSKQPRRWAYQSGGVKDLVAKLTTQSTWLVSFCSVLVVLGSLVASQLVPVDAEQEEVWRQWLPFLTPVVALLLFFHQRDARFSAKWVAVALAWRCAAELLIVLGSTPSEHLQVVLGSMALANASLLVSLISLFRNKEHQQAKASLFVLVLGSLGLFLADRFVWLMSLWCCWIGCTDGVVLDCSWLVTTENPVLESRVILMSVAVVSPMCQPAHGAECVNSMPSFSVNADDHLALGRTHDVRGGRRLDMKPAHGTSRAVAFFAFWCAARLLLRMKEYTAVPIHSLVFRSCYFSIARAPSGASCGKAGATQC